MLLIAILLLAAPTQTQGAMNRDAGADYARSDAAMTRQWQTTYAFMKRLDAGDRSRGGGFGYASALLASQRAWLKYRDAQCVIAGGEFAGGSLQPMAQAGCMARLTRTRATELKALLWQR